MIKFEVVSRCRGVFGIAFVLAIVSGSLTFGQPPKSLEDLTPQRYQFKLRASELDPHAKQYPEIGFVFEKDGKPVDYEMASVDTRVPSTGKLVLWLMGTNTQLFDRWTSQGHHAVQVHYANGWFSKLNREPPPDQQYLGRIRLEAAIGEDVSESIQIARPDSIVGRMETLITHLSRLNPSGNWDAFLNDDGSVKWELVIVSGISHGSTTGARLALEKKVYRVVMFSGPRDQFENWYSLPSATPKDRFYTFTHQLDTGWTLGHYPRSWRMLGLDQFGEILNVDDPKTSLENSHQYVSIADVGGNAERAHSASVPGSQAVRKSDGSYLHEHVWQHLFRAN